MMLEKGGSSSHGESGRLDGILEVELMEFFSASDNCRIGLAQKCPWL